MGILYCKTTGSATNSGSTDTDAATVSGAAATVAGSVVTLDGSPDLSGVVTSGASQSSIYLADATNSNMKIFWITAVDDGADTVTVHAAPTGITSSAWAIGGRVIHTPANVEGALRAGDIYEFQDSPASSASTLLTARNAGDSTSGMVTVRGISGSRPALTCSGTVGVIAPNSIALWKIDNLEIIQTGASGNALDAGVGWWFNNLKISDAGGAGIGVSANGTRVTFCEIGGGSITDGLVVGSIHAAVFGNYIHDVTGDGIEINGSAPVSLLICNNIIDTCAGRGVYFSGGSVAATAIHASLIGNTIYGCGNSGIEVVDADLVVLAFNNVLQDNGNAAGEFNVEWQNGNAERLSSHGYNLFYHAGGGGGANLSNLTANSTESTSDPSFTTPASGDFSIGSSSPAKATGFPGAFLGGPTGYADMGAVQRQEPSSSVSARVIGS